MQRVMPKLMTSGELEKSHQGGVFASRDLAKLEELLPARELERTAETGCGKSTVLFSNISREHVVFSYDDRDAGDASSVLFFERSPHTRRERITCVLGPTQETLPTYRHAGDYDCVLLDGPHGHPFPELEYFHFYPRIRVGGFLLVDDVQIPTIGRFADVIQEDEMFSLVDVVGKTAVFRRTDRPVFDPRGDGWWQQNFNRRRTATDNPYHLADGERRMSFQERMASFPAPPRRPPLGRRLRAAWRMIRRGE
jgi:hypothetical protein